MRIWAVRALLLAAVILTVFALLPRRLGKSEISRETCAIAAIRTIHTAEAEYYSQFNRYAMSLAELGRRRSARPTRPPRT